MTGGSRKLWAFLLTFWEIFCFDGSPNYNQLICFDTLLARAVGVAVGRRSGERRTTGNDVSGHYFHHFFFFSFFSSFFLRRDLFS